MLVLTRRVGETVMIGDDITVTVLGVSRNEVKLAFAAPKKVEIHREEIYEKIRREKRELVGLKPRAGTLMDHIESLRRSLQTET